jgi:hypothetical protein
MKTFLGILFHTFFWLAVYVLMYMAVTHALTDFISDDFGNNRTFEQTEPKKQKPDFNSLYFADPSFQDVLDGTKLTLREL